jgi:CHAT domain-containing protein
LAPIGSHLTPYRRLIVVPHGSLHYVPFHALFDGQRYLVESHAISYLPAASFLRYSRQNRPTGRGLLSIGYSDHGRIPHALREAQAVSTLWQPTHLLLEEEATIRQVESAASQFRILHFATHGEFRADNPLFSGLALADGWLTTLDIFNLQLQASLVTLSACYTGQHVIGGGDELLGLTRAFLAAGSSSIAITHWPVADEDTKQLVERFYANLINGLMNKDKALQLAQCDFLYQADSPWLSHPYFWAPFYLIGDAGLL